MIDVFSSFLGILSREMNLLPSWQAGFSHGVVDQGRYNSRIDAIHFAMDCDDGVNPDAYDQADPHFGRRVSKRQNANLCISCYALWTLLRELSADSKTIIWMTDCLRPSMRIVIDW